MQERDERGARGARGLHRLGAERTLTGLFPEGPYRDMGFTSAQIAEIKTIRRSRAAGGENTLFRRLFKRELHGALIQNLSRIGLLTERLAPQLAEMGIRAQA